MGIIVSRSKVRFEIRVRVAACFIGNNVMCADRTNDCVLSADSMRILTRLPLEIFAQTIRLSDVVYYFTTQYPSARTFKYRLRLPPDGFDVAVEIGGCLKNDGKEPLLARDPETTCSVGSVKNKNRVKQTRISPTPRRA